MNAEETELLIALRTRNGILGHFKANSASHQKLEEDGLVGDLQGPIFAHAFAHPSYNIIAHLKSHCLLIIGSLEHQL